MQLNLNHDWSSPSLKTLRFELILGENDSGTLFSGTVGHFQWGSGTLNLPGFYTLVKKRNV